MGSDPNSGRLSPARQLELEVRLRELADDLARQQRILDDLKRDGHSTVAAQIVMRLFMQEQAALLEELGCNPRSN